MEAPMPGTGSATAESRLRRTQHIPTPALHGNQGPQIHEQKIRSSKVLTHATPVNGWEPSVTSGSLTPVDRPESSGGGGAAVPGCLVHLGMLRTRVLAE